MTDYDAIWRMQDEIRTVVNAVLGECIWNLRWNDKLMAIELELTITQEPTLPKQYLVHLQMLALVPT
jgi:hypothetical protein